MYQISKNKVCENESCIIESLLKLKTFHGYNGRNAIQINVVKLNSLYNGIIFDYDSIFILVIYLSQHYWQIDNYYRKRNDFLKAVLIFEIFLSTFN